MAKEKKVTISTSTEIEYTQYEEGELVFTKNYSAYTELDNEKIYEVESFDPPTTLDSKGLIKLYGRFSKIRAEIVQIANEGAIESRVEGNDSWKKFFQNQIDKIKQDHKNMHNH